MSDTDIEWATKVWNFVRGCRRVSPGCGGAAGVGGCYAESQANRFKGPGQPYEGLVALGKQGPRWTGVGRFVPEKLSEPMTWRAPRDGSRHRVFVNSMSDLFFEEFSNEQIAAGFGVMAASPQHDFLILTKRAERMREWFRWYSEHGANAYHAVMAACEQLYDAGPVDRMAPACRADIAWPLPNVWLGVSAEDQQRADERIPLLLQCPAAVRWVSAEPLLGPLDLQPYLGRLPCRCCPRCGYRTNIESQRNCPNDGEQLGPDIALDWIVVGGESGNGARPCDVSWVRSIVEQCSRLKVSVFVKQLGARHGYRTPASSALVPFRLRDRKGGDPSEWPEDLRVRQFPEARP